MDMDDIIVMLLTGIGTIMIMVVLFAVYFIVCMGLGFLIEMILGWMGKDVADWYWTGVGLVALVGAVLGTRKKEE